MVDLSNPVMVPTADVATNVSMRDVVGNKSDTVAGTSLVALVKKATADVATVDGLQDVPTADSTDNVNVRDVIGNKSDTSAGTSVVAMQKLNAFSVTPVTGQTSRDASIAFAGGIGLYREDIAVAGNGAQTLNLFKFAGCIDLKEIFISVKTVADATTFSGVSFALYDGTNTVPLTDVVDASGATVGDKITKTAGAATAATWLKADQARIAESAFNKPFVECLANAKTGVDNYIRLLFTGDANTALTINAFVRYAPICLSSTVTNP